MATTRKTLRAVADNETAPAKTYDSVAEAAASGDHRALLAAMRDRISKAVSAPDCPPRDLAALTRRLQDIAKEIESIDLRRKQEGEEDVERVGDAEFSSEAL